MIARPRLTAVFAVAVACIVLPAHALASPSDATATSRYLHAAHRYLADVRLALPVARMDADSFAATTSGECPGVAAQAPAGGLLNAFGEESLLAVALAAEGTIRKATIAFADGIEHLRWSNGRLTKLVHRYAAGQRADATLAPPPLCAALREWVAGGYAALPRSTTVFLRKATAETPSDEVILASLAPYTSRARSLLHAVAHLEAQVGLAVLKLALQAASRLDEGLGLRPGPPTT